MTPTAINVVKDEVTLKKPSEKPPQANTQGIDLDGEENDDGEDETGLATGECSYRRLIARVEHQWQGDAKKKKKKKKSKKKKLEQSDPPRVGLSKLFPHGVYAEGEIQPYKDEYVSF